MIKVNNQPAIRNLAAKSFQANKTRNIIAIVAIALTTLLFTSLFTMGSGTVESVQHASMRQAGGDGHAVLKYITNQQFDTVKDNQSIQAISYNMMLCDGVENEELIKRHTEFWYYDKTGLQLGFIELEAGHIPAGENEVIADTKTLELLGVPLEIGSSINLQLDIRGETVIREFVLSGWWRSDPSFNVGQIFSSRSYMDTHADELHNTFYDDYSLTGAINAYIMFNNSINLQGKLDALLADSGFSSVEGEPNYVASNVNWSYLSTNFGLDAGTVLGLGFGLLLIVLTGYLIIYNIFQISIVHDIRFYGLLKTIGTTSKQIRRIIQRQALTLAAVGIPIGLVLGFFSGKSLVPMLMNNSAYAGSQISVSANPLIFLGSAIFALLTVFISTLKPGLIAGRVAPIEAVRYTGNESPPQAKYKKHRNGARMTSMALANLGRNKKRTLLVIISLSLSLVLLEAVVTLSGSIDMNKFLAKFNDTDFLIAHADYFNNQFYGIENETTQTFIEAAEQVDGFEAGGRLYGGRAEIFTVTDEANSKTYNRNEQGDYFAAVYGLETLPIERLELLDGEIDPQKLASGDYILEGVRLDDNQKPAWNSAHYKVGDKVTLHNYRGSSDDFASREYSSRTFTVIGHVAIKLYTNSDRVAWDYTFYLPGEVYETLVDQPAVMSYVFNVADGKESAAETFLHSYVDNVEPMMNYESKATTMSSFRGMQNTILMVGGALGGIIGLIGILNFINAVLTSIIARRQEFAMLQSIGMTRSQLRKILCCEGLYYAGLAGVFSLVCGLLVCFIIVQALCSQIWFLSYNPTIWPLLAAIPALLASGVIVPLLTYRATDKQSIVERLREAM